MFVETKVLMTPDQKQRILFVQKREEYISSLKRIIVQAKETLTLYSFNPYTPAISIVSTNSLFAFINKSTTLIDIDYSSVISSVFEDNENNVIDMINGNQTLKCFILNRRKEIITKQVVFNVLNSNIR